MQMYCGKKKSRNTTITKLGWVKDQKGYRYAGGTYLIYLGKTRPQTWHLDSKDGTTVSLIIPLTEVMLLPEFASPEHQVKNLLEVKADLYLIWTSISQIKNF